jgi:hypothetical protein
VRGYACASLVLPMHVCRIAPTVALRVSACLKLCAISLTPFTANGQVYDYVAATHQSLAPVLRHAHLPNLLALMVRWSALLFDLLSSLVRSA